MSAFCVDSAVVRWRDERKGYNVLVRPLLSLFTDQAWAKP